MARLHVMERSHAQAVMDDLHDALGRRLAARSLAPCPVEFTAALVNLCATQSCGKCTPCRVGLKALADLLEDVLANAPRSRPSTSSKRPRTPSICRATAPSATRPAPWRSWPCAASATTSSTTCASTPAVSSRTSASRASPAARPTSTSRATSRSWRRSLHRCGPPHPQGQPRCPSCAAACASTRARCTAVAASSTTH